MPKGPQGQKRPAFEACLAMHNELVRDVAAKAWL